MNVVPIQAKPSLDEAVENIHREFAKFLDHDKKAHKSRLNTGHMLLDLRARVEAGEADSADETWSHRWWKWYESKFVRTRRDAEQCMALASSENPEEAEADFKAKDAERKRKERARPMDVHRRNTDENSDSHNYVAVALLAVEKMNDEERQDFISQLKELYPWLT